MVSHEERLAMLNRTPGGAASDVGRLLCEVRELESFLARLRTGGAIVSTRELSAEDIELARSCERAHVDGDGFGYVHLPSLQELEMLRTPPPRSPA